MATTTATAADIQDLKTEYPYIVRRPGMVGGRPRVEGTRLSVELIVSLWQRGTDASELLEMYPDLTPAAVHSALAYYWDHKAEIDAEIEANRPENVLRDLRNDPDLIEVRPGVFQGRAPFGSAHKNHRRLRPVSGLTTPAELRPTAAGEEPAPSAPLRASRASAERTKRAG
ncbi:MAG: DUF433 domain-containing protein [Chloroflexota bacterium]